MARLQRVAPTSKDPDQKKTNSDFKTHHGKKDSKYILEGGYNCYLHGKHILTVQDTVKQQI